MREAKLSSYGDEQVKGSRRSTQRVSVERGRAEVARMEAEAAVDNARRSRSFVRRVLGLTSEAERSARADLDAAIERVESERAAERRTSIRTKQREAGERGERRLHRELSQRLGDEWMMFQGCMTRAGEIDAVVVGGRGVWAVEVKTRRVRLTVDGSNWTAVRVDGRGRPTGNPYPAVDGGDRTWGRQVGQAARALEQALADAGCRVPVRTVVVLMSPRAELVVRGDTGVDLVTMGTAELQKTIERSPISIDLPLQRRLETAIPDVHAAAMASRGRRRRR